MPVDGEQQSFSTHRSYRDRKHSDGQTRAPEVLNDWMGSPGHRANILRAGITSIGVGAYTGSMAKPIGANSSVNR